MLRRLIGAEMPQGFGVIVLTSLVTIFGLGILAPVLPLMVSRFDLSGVGAALLLSSYAAGRLVMAVPGGTLTDRFGYARTTTVTLAVAALSAAAAIRSPTFPVLLSVQLIQGMASGVMVTAGVSTVMALARPGSVGRTVALFQGSILAVMLFSPAVGGGATQLIGITGPFWTLLALEVLGLTVLALGLQRGVLPWGLAVGTRADEHGRWQAVRAVVRTRAFLIAFVAAFVMSWSVGAARNTIIPLFAADAFALDSAEIGLVLTLAAAGGTAAALPAGRALDRFGRRPVIQLGAALTAVTVAALAAATTPLLLVVVAVIGELARGMLNPTQSAVTADLATPTTMATLVGIGRISAPLALVVGPIMGGWFADVTSPRIAFLCAAAFLALLALPCLRMPETMPTGDAAAEGG